MIGVDGCRAGWVAVTRPLDGRGASMVEVVTDPADVVARSAHAIGVDMPIGLSDTVRDCDRAARAALGRRAATVFSAPPRACLTATTYDEACARSLEARGTKLSRQTFNLTAKIAALDAALGPADRDRVVEVHPELVFAGLAGAPLAEPKRRPEGRRARQRLLAPLVPDLARHLGARPAGVAVDDLLDAFAVAWGAARWARGEADVWGDGGLDGRGLAMRIIS